MVSAPNAPNRSGRGGRTATSKFYEISDNLGEPLFGFTHRTFLEFFAAEHLAYRKDTASELVAQLTPRIVAQEWDVVAQIALQIKARSYPDGADDVVKALYEGVRSEKGRQLTVGLNFILRFMRAVIPSPAMTGQIARNFTSLAVKRQIAGDHAEAEQILVAFAVVGPELRAEAANGVAASIVAMLRSDQPALRESGAELFAYPELIGLADDESGQVFWTDVQHKVKSETNIVHDASAKHLAIAKACFLEAGSPRELIAIHGPMVVLARTRLLLTKGTAPSVAARVLHGWRGRRRDDVALELFTALGDCLVRPDLPQLPAASRWVADVALVEAIARLSVGAALAGRVIAGLWLTAATTLEWKAGADRGTGIDLSPFTESSSQEVRAIGDTLAKRLGLDGPAVSESLAVLELEDVIAERVGRWANRTISFVARQ